MGSGCVDQLPSVVGGTPGEIVTENCVFIFLYINIQYVGGRLGS